MILIVSSVDDRSTNDVISWLIFYKQKFIRISSETEIGIKTIRINDDKHGVTLTINNNDVKLSDIKSVWYRRSEIKFNYPTIKIKDASLAKEVNRQLKLEYETLNNHVLSHIYNNSINKQSDTTINKLSALSPINRSTYE